MHDTIEIRDTVAQSRFYLVKVQAEGGVESDDDFGLLLSFNINMYHVSCSSLVAEGGVSRVGAL